MTGRIEHGKLFFQPSSGAELSRDVEELLSAASANDVNLVILHAEAPRQPGGRNWLWQKIEVGGLGNALNEATFGDFLEALAAKRGGFALTGKREGAGRMQVQAMPGAASEGIAQSASHAMDELVSHITGEVVTKAVDFHGRDSASQSEIDARLIPGIPSYVQIPLLIGIVLGLMAYETSLRWWRRLLPQPVRQSNENPYLHHLKNLPSYAVFVFLFLPLVGAPALLWQTLNQALATVLAPFRWLKGRFGRKPA